MEDIKKSTRGGKREGAGRPKVAPEDSKRKPAHYMRATPDEWEDVKRFAKCLRMDRAKAQAFLGRLEESIRKDELNAAREKVAELERQEDEKP